MGAEILMACVDNRPAAFKEFSDAGQFPIGSMCLPMPPEGGINEQSFVDAMQEYLIERFVTHHDESFLLSRTELSMLVQNHLAYLREECQRTYYVTIPKNASEPVKTAIAKLKRLFPSLVFVQTNDDLEICIRERKTLSSLRELLARRDADRSGSG